MKKEILTKTAIIFTLLVIYSTFVSAVGEYCNSNDQCPGLCERCFDHACIYRSFGGESDDECPDETIILGGQTYVRNGRCDGYGGCINEICGDGDDNNNYGGTDEFCGQYGDTCDDPNHYTCATDPCLRCTAAGHCTFEDFGEDRINSCEDIEIDMGGIIYINDGICDGDGACQYEVCNNDLDDNDNDVEDEWCGSIGDYCDSDNQATCTQECSRCASGYMYDYCAYDTICDCGNGNLDPDEECDDGGTANNDGCSSTCQAECDYLCEVVESKKWTGILSVDGCEPWRLVPPAVNSYVPGSGAPGLQCCCGTCPDAVPDPNNNEQCDDGGNGDDTDQCFDNCMFTTCGDGIVQNPNGEGIGGPLGDGNEECDDGNGNDDDTCKNDCTWNCADISIENIYPIQVVRQIRDPVTGLMQTPLIKDKKTVLRAVLSLTGIPDLTPVGLNSDIIVKAIIPELGDVFSDPLVLFNYQGYTFVFKKSKFNPDVLYHITKEFTHKKLLKEGTNAAEFTFIPTTEGNTYYVGEVQVSPNEVDCNPEDNTLFTLTYQVKPIKAYNEKNKFKIYYQRILTDRQQGEYFKRPARWKEIPNSFTKAFIATSPFPESYVDYKFNDNIFPAFADPHNWMPIDLRKKIHQEHLTKMNRKAALLKTQGYSHIVYIFIEDTLGETFGGGFYPGYPKFVLLPENAAIWQFVHESGHGLDLFCDEYYYFTGWWWGFICPWWSEEAYPYGEVVLEGYDTMGVMYGGATPKALISINPSDTRDLKGNIFSFMTEIGDHERKWISERNYYNYLKKWVDGGIDPKVIYIEGEISESDTVSFSPAYVFDGFPDDQIPSSYKLEFLDSTNNVIHSSSVTVFEITEDDNMRKVFSTFSLYPENTKKISLKENSIILETLTVSDNPPNINYVNVNDLGDELYEIDWSVSDLDNDDISVYLVYNSSTPDILGEFNESVTNYILNASQLAGGIVKIILTATDGVNTVSMFSSDFLVDNKPISFATITMPLNDSEYLEDDIAVSGYATDLENDPIVMSWYLDSQYMGNESNFDLVDLSQGSHELILEATDGTNIVSDKVTFTIDDSSNNPRTTLEDFRISPDFENENVSFYLKYSLFNRKKAVPCNVTVDYSSIYYGRDIVGNKNISLEENAIQDFNFYFVPIFDSYNLTLNISCENNNIIASEELANPWIVAWYHFDDTDGNVRDTSYYLNNGSTDALQDQDGKYKKAFYFNNNQAIIPSSESLNLSNRFTLEAWIYPEDVSGERNIISKGYELLINNGKLVLRLNNASDNFELVSDGNLVVDEWQHVMAVSNDTEIALYIDGEKNATSAPFNLGNTETDLIIGNNFKGKMDELVITYKDHVRKLKSNVQGKILLNGRHLGKNNTDSINITLKNKATSDITSYVLDTDYDGNFDLEIDPALYDIWVKPKHYLARRINNSQLITGLATLDFGISKFGDFNDDNKVDFIDIGPFSGHYGYDCSDPMYEWQFDANDDCQINFQEIGPLSQAYGSPGAEELH